MRCEYCGSMAVNIDDKSKLCDVCFYRHPLRDLLALIHRDGGHHTEEVGIRRAVDDAINIIYNLRQNI